MVAQLMSENKTPTIEFLTEHTTIELDHMPAIRYLLDFQDSDIFAPRDPTICIRYTLGLYYCQVFSFELAQGSTWTDLAPFPGIALSGVLRNEIDLSYRRERGNILMACGIYLATRPHAVVVHETPRRSKLAAPPAQLRSFSGLRKRNRSGLCPYLAVDPRVREG
jgi:hypothetical protein